MQRRFWTKSQTIVLFKVYLCTDFNDVMAYERNIQEFSKLTGRNTHAIKMKMKNFASLDLDAEWRGAISSNIISQRDKKWWEEYYLDRDKLDKDYGVHIRGLVKFIELNRQTWQPDIEYLTSLRYQPK